MQVRRERKGTEGGFGIAFCQKGKCSSSSRVKEGCRVREEAPCNSWSQLSMEGIAECTGACVFASVCVCRVEALQGEG